MNSKGRDHCCQSVLWFLQSRIHLHTLLLLWSIPSLSDGFSLVCSFPWICRVWTPQLPTFNTAKLTKQKSMIKAHQPPDCHSLQAAWFPFLQILCSGYIVVRVPVLWFCIYFRRCVGTAEKSCGIAPGWALVSQRWVLPQLCTHRELLQHLIHILQFQVSQPLTEDNPKVLGSGPLHVL